jgi:hypothetical protein
MGAGHTEIQTQAALISRCLQDIFMEVANKIRAGVDLGDRAFEMTDPPLGGCARWAFILRASSQPLPAWIRLGPRPSYCRLRECVVEPTPAITVTPAPASSKADITPTLEHRIGALVATAGIAIAEALDEHRHGALSPRTKMRGGDLICELVRLRQFLIAGLPNFDRVAREHGVAMLRAADVSLATASVLVDEVLDLMHKVTRIALN